MAHTKSSDIRYQVLDRCLRSGTYSTSQLAEEVNRELRLRGYLPVTSLNTIRKDLDHMVSNHNVVIDTLRSGRNVQYTYADHNMSIYKVMLTDEDIRYVSHAISVISRFKDMTQMDWRTLYTKNNHRTSPFDHEAALNSLCAASESMGVDSKCFREIVNATHIPGPHPEDILLEVDNNLLKYLDYRPIHRTQTVVKPDEKTSIVAIHMMPDSNLVQTLLSYGPAVTVLSPEYLREYIASQVDGMMSNYLNPD